MLPIVLASSSPYRRALLARLGVEFGWESPAIDETARPGETAAALAARLAETKAHALADRYPAHLIIGSDQVASLDGKTVGKPHTMAVAVEQLTAASGRSMTFQTGLCLLDSRSGEINTVIEPFTVHFRALNKAQVARYLDREQPLDCAGSFKAEGLGIALFERLEGADPNSLIGLPLIQLVTLLNRAGISIP